jgi:hypothetical protein
MRHPAIRRVPARARQPSRYPQSPGPGQAAIPVCLQFRGSGHPKLQTNHLPSRAAVPAPGPAAPIRAFPARPPQDFH